MSGEMTWVEDHDGGYTCVAGEYRLKVTRHHRPEDDETWATGEVFRGDELVASERVNGSSNLFVLMYRCERAYAEAKR